MKTKGLERAKAAFYQAGRPPLCLLTFLLALMISSCSSPVDLGMSDIESVELPEDCFMMQLPSDNPIRLVVAPDFSVCRERYCEGLSTVMLEFRKNRPAAVLAYLPSSPRPYGAIYPYTDKLEGKDGYAAEILLELYSEPSCTEQEKENIRLFNWHKLMELLREQDDPWLVDSDKIKEAIKSGKFSKSKIKKWAKDSPKK
ncbi:MAG: hypothetical protein IJU95_11045 [Treponema sp.]|nr:hypothetical protein [Treponema sp.]